MKHRVFLVTGFVLESAGAPMVLQGIGLLPGGVNGSVPWVAAGLAVFAACLVVGYRAIRGLRAQRAVRQEGNST